MKCHHLHIGKNPDGQSYTMQTPQGTITIDSVESEKDLGVIIDKSLSFGEPISSKISVPIESKKISNDQELIQSDPTPCPQNQKGNN